jgi:hypothetical protein
LTIRDAVEAEVAFSVRKKARSGLFLLVSVTGVSLLAQGGKLVPAGLPDASTGQINGKIAITVAPVRLVKREILPPWGFTAHLTGYDDPKVDFAFPSGLWFQPPGGRYRVWVEGEWQISPFTYVVRYSPQRFQGSGQIAVAAVGDAGRVVLPSGVAERPNLFLRLLHAGSHMEEGYTRWELSRRATIREAGKGLLMPVGPAIGALWDEDAQQYTALSHPFEVQARQTVEIPLEQPSGVAHLVVQLQRPNLAVSAEDADVKMELICKSRKLAPDLEVRLADRAYAVWYGLAAGPAELRAETRDALLRPQQLSLTQGKIERVFAKMAPRSAWAARPVK